VLILIYALAAAFEPPPETASYDKTEIAAAGDD
jgi:hypothetical protein